MTSTGVLGRPRVRLWGRRRQRSALTRWKSSSSSSSRSNSRSSGSNSIARFGTISNRFTGAYRSTIMVPGPPAGGSGWHLILPPGGPISHHKLILVHLEAIRWCIRAAELEPTALPWGVKAGEVPLRVALNHSINCYAQVQKVVRDLAGGHVTTNQTYHDL